MRGISGCDTDFIDSYFSWSRGGIRIHVYGSNLCMWRLFLPQWWQCRIHHFNQSLLVNSLNPFGRCIRCIGSRHLLYWGRYKMDTISQTIFSNEFCIMKWIPIKLSLKFVPMCPIKNIPVLVHIMAWRRPGDKPLYEPLMVNLPTHKCVTRPQCV